VLSEAVAERLRGRNLDPESVEWDAWRREDGRWTLVADYRSGERARHAEFVFDAPGRYVVAEDDEARWLVGEPTSSKGPQPRSTPGPRRLSSVNDHDELPLGEDAIELVSDDPPAARQVEEPADSWDEPAAEAVDEPATEAVDAPVRAPAAQPVAEEAWPGTADADWMATQASERPPREDPAPDPVEHPVELGSEADETDVADDAQGDETHPAPAPAPAAEAPAAEAPAAEAPAAEAPAAEVPPAEAPAASDAEPADVPAAPRRTTKKNRRPSVPSWDEIMFGGGKQE
jgi:hypothetical protein